MQRMKRKKFFLSVDCRPMVLLRKISNLYRLNFENFEEKAHFGTVVPTVRV